MLLSLKMALRSIGANKLRAALTMLGIIIGVLALVVLVSLVSGTTNTVTDAVSGLGSSLMTVTLEDEAVDLDQIDRWAEEADLVGKVSVSQSASVTGKHEGNAGSVTLYGVTPDYYDIQGLQLLMGRWLKRVDLMDRTYVCIINETAAEELIGYNLVVGETPVEPAISASVAGILGLDILEGARVRIAPDAIENSGLRFDGYVNEDVFTAIVDAGFIAWVGTAITTEDRLDAVDGDWAALEDDVDKLTVDAGDFVNGPDYNFTGAIINIKEDNYDVNFVATTYITIILVEGQEATEDTEAVEEVSITIYAENETVRSIEYVATQALKDEEANYTEAQKAILNAYVGA